MKWNIIPNQGIGDLSFGLSREEIRGIINSPFTTFSKIVSDPLEPLTDSFDSLGFFVYYDENDKCEAIEFYELSYPLFEGKELLKLSYKEFKKIIKSFDKKLEEDNEGFTSKKLGIGCYAPDKEDDPKCLPEGIIIFKKGYYE